MATNKKRLSSVHGIIRNQVPYLLVHLLLAGAMLTLGSCASSGTSSPHGSTAGDAGVARIETVLDPNMWVRIRSALTNNTSGRSASFNDYIMIRTVDGSSIKMFRIVPVRVLPGSCSIEVETSHVTDSSGGYGAGGSYASRTSYTREHWLFTFPVIAGATYCIVRGHEAGVPPSVYRIVSFSLPGEYTAPWYSQQEAVIPVISKYYYKKDRTPTEWFLKDEQVIAHFSKVMEVCPAKAFHCRQRAAAYGRKSEYDRAIADYSKAIEIDPHDDLAYHGRGYYYGEKGEYDLAIADCSKAIELDPQDHNAYNNRGYYYGEKGEYDLAIADFSKAIKIEPKDDIAYKNRGRHYAKQGEYDLAVADYSRAIKLVPDDAGVLRRRAEAYSEMGKGDRAAADYAKAKAIEAKRAR